MIYGLTNKKEFCNRQVVEIVRCSPTFMYKRLSLSRAKNKRSITIVIYGEKLRVHDLLSFCSAFLGLE